MQRMRTLWREITRRHVLGVTGAYVALIWLLAQTADIFEIFGLPLWLLRSLIVGGILGIPIVIWLSWRFELAPIRVVRDPMDALGLKPTSEVLKARHDVTEAGFLLVRCPDSPTTENQQFLDPVTIGRNMTSNIRFDDDRVNRNHAILWAEHGNWYVRDLNSANGTYLNGERVRNSAMLPDKCTLRLHSEGPSIHIRIETQPETVVAK